MEQSHSYTKKARTASWTVDTRQDGTPLTSAPRQPRSVATKCSLFNMEAGALPVPPRSTRMTSTEFPLPVKVTEKEDRGPTRFTPSEVCAYSYFAEISRPYVHVASGSFRQFIYTIL